MIGSGREGGWVSGTQKVYTVLMNEPNDNKMKNTLLTLFLFLSSSEKLPGTRFF